jgi:hypothetical protein
MKEEEKEKEKIEEGQTWIGKMKPNSELKKTRIEILGLY